MSERKVEVIRTHLVEVRNVRKRSRVATLVFWAMGGVLSWLFYYGLGFDLLGLKWCNTLFFGTVLVFGMLGMYYAPGWGFQIVALDPANPLPKEGQIILINDRFFRPVVWREAE